MRRQESGENCITRRFVFLFLAKYNQNNQVEEDEIGGACSTNGGEEQRI
jgi:hypothetical protein